MLVAASVKQGLLVHVSGRIPGTAGLDWSSGEARKARVGGEGSSPILDWLNQSPELWLQTIAGFGKRRSVNSVTPASRFKAAANTTLRPIMSDR